MPTPATITDPSPRSDILLQEQPDEYMHPGTCLCLRLTRERILRCSRIIVRQHIDAFFEYIYPVPVFSFLHRADFLSQYSSKTLDPILLLAVCGASARFLPPANRATNEPKQWIERAELMAFKSLGKDAIPNIQALMILALHRSYKHQPGKAFYYISLAARMAFSLKLHKEDHSLSFVEQECRRRLLWCIFCVDRFHAGGIPVKFHPTFPRNLIESCLKMLDYSLVIVSNIS